MTYTDLSNDFGFLSSVWTLGAAVVLILAAIIGWLKMLNQETDVSTVASEEQKSKWDVANARRIARIAIVDDELSDFPVSELRKSGYKITTYKKITLSKIPELENFDVLLLDMKGIIDDDLDYGGLKLIAELRKTPSLQKICAVSSKTFDPTATEFFKQADDYKKKPLTAQECREVIDEFIGITLNLPRLLNSAAAILDGLPRPAKVAIIKGLKRPEKQTGEAMSGFDDILRSLSCNGASRATLINLFRVLHA